MKTDLKYPDVKVQLSGEDGNVYSIIGRVKREIRRKHGHEAADAFAKEAMSKGSYEEVLGFVQQTVDVY